MLKVKKKIKKVSLFYFKYFFKMAQNITYFTYLVDWALNELKKPFDAYMELRVREKSAVRKDDENLSDIYNGQLISTFCKYFILLRQHIINGRPSTELTQFVKHFQIRTGAWKRDMESTKVTNCVIVSKCVWKLFNTVEELVVEAETGFPTKAPRTYRANSMTMNLKEMLIRSLWGEISIETEEQYADLLAKDPAVNSGFSEYVDFALASKEYGSIEENGSPNELVSEPNELVSEPNELVSEPNELVSESDELVSESDELVSESDELDSEWDELDSESDELDSEPYESLEEEEDISDECDDEDDQSIIDNVSAAAVDDDQMIAAAVILNEMPAAAAAADTVRVASPILLPTDPIVMFANRFSKMCPVKGFIDVPCLSFVPDEDGEFEVEYLNEKGHIEYGTAEPLHVRKRKVCDAFTEEKHADACYKRRVNAVLCKLVKQVEMDENLPAYEFTVIDSYSLGTSRMLLFQAGIKANRINVFNYDPYFKHKLPKSSRHLQVKIVNENVLISLCNRDNEDLVSPEHMLFDFCCKWETASVFLYRAMQRSLIPRKNGIIWLTVSRRNSTADAIYDKVQDWMGLAKVVWDYNTSLVFKTTYGTVCTLIYITGADNVQNDFGAYQAHYESLD
jgi:hypothetical protein